VGANAGGAHADAAIAVDDLPAVVLDRLDAIAQLRDLPFGYLVPDLTLVPPESLRVFRVDEEWVKAAQAGLLSVAEQSTSDRLTRLPAPGLTRTGPLSGFLLRSRVIVDHPGVQVLAYDDAGIQLEPVRIDRPAAGVLLVVVAGVLSSIAIEEPHHGLRLGVGATNAGEVIRLRGSDGRTLAGAADVAVPWRDAAPDGVLDVAELARRIDNAGVPGVPSPTGSGALALQLIRPPVRQRFAGGAP
jgi:hypothetical protein